MQGDYHGRTSNKTNEGVRFSSTPVESNRRINVSHYGKGIMDFKGWKREEDDSVAFIALYEFVLTRSFNLNIPKVLDSLSNSLSLKKGKKIVV